MIYAFTCSILRFLCRVLFPIEHHGLKNVPERGSCIIASNHVSFLDPIVIGVFLKRNLNYLAKKELLEIRALGWYIQKLRVMPVEQDILRYSSAKKIVAKIQEGEIIGIFPEGTRGNGKEFLEPEPGVGYFALKFNLPVVPVYVKGTEKVLPKGAHFTRREPVDVYYGSAKRYSSPAGLSKDEAYKEVADRIMEEIKSIKLKYG